MNKTKYLNDDEYKYTLSRLIDGVRRWPDKSIPLLLALKTGARANELFKLRVNDLDIKTESIFIKGIKNSLDREIPLDPQIVALLHQWIMSKNYNENDLLFNISYHTLRRYWTQFGPHKKKFHCLRHTFAIQIYKKTKDIRLVKVALGHKSLYNTMIYADYVYSKEEMRKIIG